MKRETCSVSWTWSRLKRYDSQPCLEIRLENIRASVHTSFSLSLSFCILPLHIKHANSFYQVKIDKKKITNPLLLKPGLEVKTLAYNDEVVLANTHTRRRQTHNIYTHTHTTHTHSHTHTTFASVVNNTCYCCACIGHRC